jgi:hypothetical protein
MPTKPSKPTTRPGLDASDLSAIIDGLKCLRGSITGSPDHQDDYLFYCDLIKRLEFHHRKVQTT